MVTEVEATPVGDAAATRRERLRATTTQEIKDTARRLLVAGGAGTLSLRAIAREMGMTAPGLYRYFDSREDLLKILIKDLYDEVCDEMEAAWDRRPPDPADRLLTVSRTFRRWSLGHPVEFELIFGSAAAPEVGTVREWYRDPETGPQRRFAGVFGELITEIWLRRPFPVTPDEQVDPELREQLLAWCATMPAPLPLGLLEVFLRCWISLFGAVALEAFGHLKFAVNDASAVFEAVLRGNAELLHVTADYDAITAANR